MATNEDVIKMKTSDNVISNVKTKVVVKFFGAMKTMLELLQDAKKSTSPNSIENTEAEKNQSQIDVFESKEGGENKLSESLNEAEEEPIEIQCSAEILGKVVEWCEYHQNHPEFLENQGVKEIETASKKEKRVDDIPSWDLQYLQSMSVSNLHQLLLATNYFDVKPLGKLACKYTAKLIKEAKSVEKIREVFGITNTGFTLQEVENLEKQNEWIEKS